MAKLTLSHERPVIARSEIWEGNRDEMIIEPHNTAASSFMYNGTYLIYCNQVSLILAPLVVVKPFVRECELCHPSPVKKIISERPYENYPVRVGISLQFHCFYDVRMLIIDLTKYVQKVYGIEKVGIISLNPGLAKKLTYH